MSKSKRKVLRRQKKGKRDEGKKNRKREEGEAQERQAEFEEYESTKNKISNVYGMTCLSVEVGAGLV